MMHQTVQSGFALICLGSMLGACSAQHDREPEGATLAVQTALTEDELAAPEQPLNVVYAQEIVDGRVAVNHAPTTLPSSAFSKDEEPRIIKKDQVRAAPAAPKVSTLLASQLAQAKAGGSNPTVTVMVTFQEDTKLPRFPSLRGDEARSSSFNTAILSRNEALVQRVRDARAAGYAQRGGEILARHGAKVRETFWLINGMTIDIPADAVEALAQRADVLHIEPLVGGGANGTMADARGLMVTDPYYNVGLASGYIGSIDSGVRSSHCLLLNALSWVRDCVNGTSNNCGTGVGIDPSDSLDHGTAAAAILTGRPHNNCFTWTERGVTGIQVDSFKVHVPGGGTSADGMTRAYSAAVAGGDDVITTSMWLPGDAWPETSGVSLAANHAFDAGKVIIASGGNTGPAAAPIECPANARRVVAVGAVDSVSPYTYQNYTSRGPTSDGRFKPDFLAPTNVTTANNSSDTGTGNFGGTSAAAPNAAGAAALWHNWAKQAVPAVEPGQIYAHLIAMGDSYDFSNTAGAGILKLPLNTFWTGGKTTVSQGQNVTIPVTIGGTLSRIDAAIWWPDSDTIQHSDIDLKLLDPSGAQKAQSVSTGSIFEKTRAATTTTGTWQLQLKGYSVKAGVNQTVYWVFHQLY